MVPRGWILITFVSPTYPEKYQDIWWIGTTSCTDIHGFQMLTFPVYPHHEVDICGFERNALITIERIAFKLGAGTPALARMHVNPNLFLVKSLKEKKKPLDIALTPLWFSDFGPNCSMRTCLHNKDSSSITTTPFFGSLFQGIAYPNL